MDSKTVIELVSSLGFPIAMCCALFWYMIRQRDAHDKETKSLSDCIDKNTRVLTEITTLIKTLVK